MSESNNKRFCWKCNRNVEYQKDLECVDCGSNTRPFRLLLDVTGDNYYSATAIMEYRESWDADFWLKVNDDGYDELVRKSDWNPDTDRNQLAMVLEKVDETLWQKVFTYMFDLPIKRPSGWSVGGYGGSERCETQVKAEAWVKPAKALAAIVKAHEEASK